MLFRSWVTDLFDLEALAGHLGRDRLGVYVSGEGSVQKSTFENASAHVLQALVSQNEAGLREFLAAAAVSRP